MSSSHSCNNTNVSSKSCHVEHRLTSSNYRNVEFHLSQNFTHFPRVRHVVPTKKQSKIQISCMKVFSSFVVFSHDGSANREKFIKDVVRDSPPDWDSRFGGNSFNLRSKSNQIWNSIQWRCVPGVNTTFHLESKMPNVSTLVRLFKIFVFLCFLQNFAKSCQIQEILANLKFQALIDYEIIAMIRFNEDASIRTMREILPMNFQEIQELFCLFCWQKSPGFSGLSFCQSLRWE